MLAKDSGAGSNFDLPEDVLEVLPSDPFEQLDVARKITSIALSTRVSALESEASALRRQLSDKDATIADLHAQIESLDFSLSDVSEKLGRADDEKESLLKENELLSNTVKKLNRDVAKLESFRKTLMQSLQDEEGNPVGAPQVVSKHVPSYSSLSSQALAGDDDATLPPSRTSSMRSQFSDVGNSYSEDHEVDASRPRISPGLLLASQTTTPRLTPPGSPPILSATVSPTRTSKPASPRRHSISFATTRGMFDDRPSVFSSVPSSQHNSMSRLSYEQFGAFLANVKELNSRKQTREATLRKVDEIFGSENKDLYAVFEGLITRNVH
ncbi:hypothetical protein RJ639_012065 [Escallonia herrerae]|uniref:At4g15545-like C-terminal domain-containing protein n=1 Tax=Escallonia herrerae TaxID=1293975 RepID=A0AA89ATH3_9ASTE|nr:hypothetical protein RJ639_012065 [Escallonia herrerae]